MSITGFATEADLQKDLEQRGRWIGMGDERVNKSNLLQMPKDISNTALAFEPQRIRQFIVTFEKTLPQPDKTAAPAAKQEVKPKSNEENLGKNDHTNKDRITDKLDLKQPK